MDWRLLGFTGGPRHADVSSVRAAAGPAGNQIVSGFGHARRRPKHDAGRSVSACAGAGGTQVALSLVLLVGALLFVRTLRNLLTTEAGFNAEGVITVESRFRSRAILQRTPAGGVSVS